MFHHPKAIISLYFMLIYEAFKLVLNAGNTGKGGEIVILDMDAPPKVVYLVKVFDYPL